MKFYDREKELSLKKYPEYSFTYLPLSMDDL
jgi:hypothetical protein